MNMLKICFPSEFKEHAPNFHNNLNFSLNVYECLQILPNATQFPAINANLHKIAFGRAFAREILYM